MRQWLYNKDGGKLFENDVDIEKAIKNGYVDTPAKLENKAIDDNIDTFSDTVEGLKTNHTVTQLRAKCKELEIVGMSKANEDKCAQAIFDFYNKEEE